MKKEAMSWSERKGATWEGLEGGKGVRSKSMTPEFNELEMRLFIPLINSHCLRELLS